MERILWMEEILHQLVDGVSLYLYDFNHPFGGAGFLPFIGWESRSHHHSSPKNPSGNTVALAAMTAYKMYKIYK